MNRSLLSGRRTAPVVAPVVAAFLAILASLVWIVAPVAAEEPGQPRGAEIYRRQCAKCHGANGEGSADQAPLRGEHSVTALADVIARTMPEDRPELCQGDDAAAVAAYIHGAFYRLPPPDAKLAVSRLTAKQHQRAAVDLLSSFLGRQPRLEETGLSGEYFDDRRMANDKKKLTRVDPGVAFELGTRSPLPGQISNEAFAIRWQGSVIPRRSGEHEFIVETENGARLWINDSNTPFIDGWVKSGGRARHRAVMSLLAGRAYYLRLEFFSFKEQTAAIHLKWVAPGGVERHIPADCLSPQTAPMALTLETKFPPDDSSFGFERGVSISSQWDRASTDAALETARWVVANIDRLAGIKQQAGDDERKEQARQFCATLLRRAARQPWPEDPATLAQRLFESSDLETAISQCVVVALKSPRFTFRTAGLGPFDSRAAAEWLSFGLWDSIPDTRLDTAAAAGQLQTREQLETEARRMLDDPRAKAKLREMMDHYLTLDRELMLTKDAELFDGFDASLAEQLRDSLEQMIEQVIWSEHSSFQELMLTAQAPTTQRMRQFYGLQREAPVAPLPPWESLDDWRLREQRAASPSELPTLEDTEWPQQRGLLTHPYLMSVLAYDDTSSPIHRGVFLTRHVLGRRLKPPPEAVTPIPAKEHANLTTRQRVELQTKATVCQTCHGTINALGFPLESFDAVGRFRSDERGLKLDLGGHYHTTGGQLAEFAGAEALSKFVAGSRDAHRSFVEQLLEHTTKQPAAAFGPNTLEELTDWFEANEYNVRELWVEIVVRTALAVQASQSKPGS
ncbi:MAG: DUF1592 domain-containing protein [Planctomycetales bacterium]|nr:DUF1592 domain-containing protein [Planctomycetales bacterium]